MMRKDVKFGLTVAGILVATLVVYVIVLSGGGLSSTNKEDGKTIATGDGGVGIAHAGGQNPETPGDLASCRHNCQAQRPTAPTTPPPANLTDNHSSTTAPSDGAQARTDWDFNLTHGTNPALASNDPSNT